VARPDRTGARRILWSSNAPFTGTGYGEQTAQAVSRIKRDGYEVAVATNYGVEGTITEWEGVPLYPRGLDVYSNDVIPAHAMHWGKPSGQQPLVVTLFDCWVFRGAGWDILDRIASWVPVDHFPLVPEVAKWLAKDNVTPIAMSMFGKDTIERAGIETRYIPHAIDTKVFNPTELIHGTEGSIPARKWMDVPEDAYLVGMNSANKGTWDRKGFAEAFLAMGMMMQRHEDVWFYLHTEATPAMNGLDLKALAAACGIPTERLRFVDVYSYRTNIPKEALAAIYSAMDVLLQPSRGEGFGIPAIEAQACGVPIIVSDATAQPELVGDGWKVEVQPTWDHGQGSWFFTPLVGSIVDALEEAYDRGRGVSDTAVAFAQGYDADLIYRTGWAPLLEELTA
jgi:glycosyltransferase involved in cell wall biosynthesis